MNYLEAFLGSVGSTSLRGISPSSSLLGVDKAPDLPGASPYQLEPGRPSPGWPTLLRPPFGHCASGGTGMSTRFPSPTPFGLSLGID
jgi:hypothetical protein